MTNLQLLGVVVGGALVAFTGWSTLQYSSHEDRAAASRAERKAKRQERAAKADAPITPRVLAVGKHQVVVVNVPSVSTSGYVNERVCYVWRDMEFKTASFSCESDTEYVSTKDFDSR